MKIAFDIHGVIDTDPEFFSQLTEVLTDASNSEVHILTGSRIEQKKIKAWLEERGIWYTHLFSIADYLREKGCTELEGSTEDNPWYSEGDWNRAKAQYCKEHGINLCLDDRDEYMVHFHTPVARFYSKDR